MYKLRKLKMLVKVSPLFAGSLLYFVMFFLLIQLKAVVIHAISARIEAGQPQFTA